MSSLKIKPFAKRLIKENILYIISNIFLLILIIVLVNISISKLTKIKNQTKILNDEVSELKNKFNLLNTIVPSTEVLESNIKILNSLVPNFEDYFSLIYALDSLSQKTGFQIIGYTVNMKKSTAEKIKLKVTGIGDSASFLNFLENYNFGGGRLITSDKIEFNTKIDDSINIDLTFYNKKVVVDYKQKLVINKQIFEEIEALKSRVDFNFEETTELENENLNLEYPKKTDLF